MYQPSLTLQVADRIFKTSLDGLFFLQHQVHSDERGFYAELGIIDDLQPFLPQPFILRQFNQARSTLGVAKGFHAEAWNKLITVTSGSCVTAIADVRLESATFGQVEVFQLGLRPEDLQGSLYISGGLGNSLCVIDGPLDYIYCVDQLYRNRDTTQDQAISLFDPDLAVNWPIPPEKMILSNRDRQAVSLREKFPTKFTQT